MQLGMNNPSKPEVIPGMRGIWFVPVARQMTQNSPTKQHGQCGPDQKECLFTVSRHPFDLSEALPCNFRLKNGHMHKRQGFKEGSGTTMGRVPRLLLVLCIKPAVLA